jgi:hypothetical protein
MSMTGAGVSSSGPELQPKKMYDAVRVTAADYNGKTWDGGPFSAMPEWLEDALELGKIVPHTHGGTDYAQWWVYNRRSGEAWNATPGDWIVFSDDNLYVVKDHLARGIVARANG